MNQGRVSIGLPTVKRDHPDVHALEVMNEILGGSGFTSRITKTVRSNEGLAYSAGSGLAPGVWYPGRFRAGFQSKSRSVPYATSLVLEEIRKIREESVTPEELDTIKNNIVQTFPSSFASKAQSMAIFASDEYTRRDPAWWATYRDRIQAVTAADVQRVAREHLVPEKMIVLVVGNQAEIDLGDEKHPVTLARLAPGGKVTSLPLRDPMTMKARSRELSSWDERPASTKSLESNMGLLLLTLPVRKSAGPSWCSPFQTSRKSSAGPLKKQSASSFFPFLTSHFSFVMRIVHFSWSPREK